MDELSDKRQKCILDFNKRFPNAPLEIKNRFISFIEKIITNDNFTNFREMTETLELNSIDPDVFDRELINIVSRDIPVDELLAEVNSMPDNWLINQARQKNIKYQKDTESIALVKTVPLFLGSNHLAKSYNSHVYRKTNEYKLYPNVTAWLDSFAAENNLKIAWISIVKLKVGGILTEHIDYGEYYKKRDRYHLCLDGAYRYSVLDKEEIITAGTLFRFNNKCAHSAVNIADIPRICIIFDTEQLN